MLRKAAGLSSKGTAATCSVLCQLVIDILKLDCLCIIIKPYTADTIRKHPVKRNALLCRLRYAIIFLGISYDLPYCHLVCFA